MSATDSSKANNGKGEQQNNAVIEIKISIPPLFGGNISSLFDDFAKAAKELAKVGRTFIGNEEKEPVKMRKIEIK